MELLQKHKNHLVPINWGWSKRRTRRSYYRIIIHTTNGTKGSQYENEVKYLLASKNVSAHYVVSKDVRVTETLPIELCAWHVGTVIKSLYSNDATIGIEQHYTLGEPILQQQKDTLRELCQYLMKQVRILDIETHRAVAFPIGRKIDPSNFTDEEFTRWKQETMNTQKYMTITNGATIYTSPDFDHPIATHITNEHITKGMVIYWHTALLEPINDQWYHYVNGIGFVESKYVSK